MNFASLIDFLNHSLPIMFDLIDIALQLGDKLLHLVLIILLFSKFILKHGLALNELFTVHGHIIDFLVNVHIVAFELLRLLFLNLAHFFQFKCFILNLLVSVLDLSGLLFNSKRLCLELLDHVLKGLFLESFFL